MKEVILSVIGGGCGAAGVGGIFSVFQYRMARRDRLSERADAQNKALRYLMLYIIQ